MSLEQLGKLYQPITTKRFFLPQNWDRNPLQLTSNLKKMLELGTDVLWKDDSMTAEFNFRMPHETHILPLFQNAIYHHLVDLHNNWDETEYYIHPLTIMMFDSRVSNLSTDSKRFHRIGGEDAVLHELKHLWALQDIWNNPANGLIGFDLSWQEVPKKKIQFLVASGFHGSFEELNPQDAATTAFAPLYPSSVDHKLAENDIESISWMGKLKKRYIRDKLNHDKLLEQGFKSPWLTFLYDPISVDSMFGVLFKQWKELTKDEIDFGKWSGVMKNI